VGAAPTFKPFADLLGADEATVRKVLTSMGPGRYDAELSHDARRADRTSSRPRR
jgi:hypothetical protein